MSRGKTAAPSAFRSRIVGDGEEAPDQLLANPLNWRVHPKEQVDALEGLLKQVGWVQRVIVNKRTGHVVDGHARVALALRRAEPTLPVLYVDLSEDEERLVLAAIDPIGGMAGRDDDMLAQVLEGLTAEDAGLQALLDGLAGADSAGAAPPAPPDTGIAYEEKFAVLVTCTGEPHQREVFEALQGMGYEVKVLVN